MQPLRAYTQVLVLFWATTAAVASPAFADQLGDRLLPGQSLDGFRSDFISPTPTSVLRLELDGCDLVLKLGPFGKLWDSSSGAAGSGCVATMQTDGNFVVYALGNRAIWASNTQGHPGAYATIQADGNVVIYSGAQVISNAIWATSTAISYTRTCQNITMSPSSGGTITANCIDFFGGLPQTTISGTSQCQGVISNVDGTLRCVVSQNPGFVDIVSVPVQTANETTWRIDRPNVRLSTDPFQEIQYKPGDLISVQAGGCVQTGGHGLTWKRYVDPSGSNANPLYMGSITIPGTDFGQQTLLGINNKTELVSNIPTFNNFFATLGYSDDDYGDNGYWGHDDGNNGQCAGIGPAWVEVSVSTPTPGSTQTPTPRTLPFDLVWSPGSSDGNGLAMNPAWYPQTTGEFALNGALGKNFHGVCGPAFPDDTTMDDAALGRICTSEGPTMNLMSPGLINDIAGLFKFCAGDPIRGHLNWGIYTYTGGLALDGWSVGIGGDHDLNFDLFRNDNAGLTATANSSEGEPALHLEFNLDELLPFFASPWWRDFTQTAMDVDYDLTPNAEEANALAADLVAGKSAVVTGEFGIDGVHDDGQSELHPVYSMAIRTDDTIGQQSVDETWAFFMRNWGNEGNCSSYGEQWNSVYPLPNTYFITLPWPTGASSVSLGANQVWSWGNWSNSTILPQPTQATIQILETVGQWTYLGLQISNVPGADGQITLHYGFPAGVKPTKYRAITRPAESKVTDEGPQIVSVRTKQEIIDPGTGTALVPLELISPNPGGHLLTINPHINTYRPWTTPASKGLIVRSVATAAVVKTNQTQVHSGSILESASSFERSTGATTSQTNTDQFDMVVPQGGRLAHYYRDNIAQGQPWHAAADVASFGSSAEVGSTVVNGAALLRSNQGALEVAAWLHGVSREIILGSRVGPATSDYLVLFEQNPQTKKWSQSSPIIADGKEILGVTGTPAFIQSTQGNFEIVVPEGGRLAHYWRDNATPGQPWHQDADVASFGSSATTGSTTVNGTTLLESSEGNLEVIAWLHSVSREVILGSRVGPATSDYLVLFEQNPQTKKWSQSSPIIADGKEILGVSATPAFIQSKEGQHGNFEIVVPERGQLANYWRDNDAPGQPWHQANDVVTFGASAAGGSTTVSGASMLQNSWGNLEVVAWLHQISHQIILGSGAHAVMSDFLVTSYRDAAAQSSAAANTLKWSSPSEILINGNPIANVSGPQ